LGCVLIYGTLFGIGKIIFKDWLTGLLYLAIAIAAGLLISWNLSRVGWETVGESEVEPSREPA